MVSFVEAGLKALQTPEMIQTIIKAFETHGRFGIMRSPDMQLSALSELMSQDLNIANGNIVSVPVGDEISNDDEEAAHPREFSDDDDDDDSDDD